MEIQTQKGISGKLLLQQQSFAQAVLLFLLFAYPVSSFLSAFAGVSSNVFSLAIRGLSVVLAGLYVLFLLWHRIFFVYRSSIFIFFFFWLLYLPRLIYDTQVNEAQLGIDSGLYLLFGIVLSFFLAIPLFVYCEYNEAKLEKHIFLIVTVLNVLSLYFALQQEEAFITRVGGNEKLNPISTGVMATLSIAISFKWIIAKKAGGIGGFLLLLANIGLGAVVLVLISTKSMIIVLLFFIFLLIFLQNTGFAIRAIIILIATILVFAMLVLLTNSGDLLELTYMRFVNVEGDQSSQERLDMIRGAIAQFQSSPFIGDFIEERSLHMYPHNVILESFMALGIPGGIVFLVLFFGFCLQTLRLALYTRLGILSMLAFIQIMLAMVSSSICFSPELWYMIAVVSSHSLNPMNWPAKRSSLALNIFPPDSQKSLHT